MKRIITITSSFLIACSLLIQSVQAQGLAFNPVKTGSVCGSVQDSKSGLPVSFAEIIIVDAYSNKKVASVTADESGFFSCDQLLTGTYQLKITTKGFDTYRSLPFMISELGKAKDFDQIRIGEKLLINQAGQVGEAGM